MTLGHLDKTKKHEHGKDVVAALDVEVRPPTRRTLRSSLCPSWCTVAWFAIAATFAGLFGWSFDAWKALEAEARDEIDVSGYGQCNGTHILATRAWSWWQSPHPSAPANVTVPIPQGFVGKNAIVWSSGENASVHTAHVAAIDNMTITLESPHHVTEECHFTLDGTTSCTYFNSNANTDIMVEQYQNYCCKRTSSQCRSCYLLLRNRNPNPCAKSNRKQER